MDNRFKNNHKAALKLNEVQQKEVAIVKEKIASGTYKFEPVSCPICGETKNFDKLAEKDRYGFYFPMTMCGECGLVMANPRMREPDYEDFYVSGHQKRAYVGKDRAGENYFQIQYKKGQSIYNNVSKSLNTDRPLRVLEVGCGAGGILKVFKENGHHIKGLDLNPEYINYGAEFHKLNLSTQNLFEINGETYDLIIYSHVLEHLIDPSAHLTFIKSLLSDNGMVYIEVPGVKMSYEKYGDILRYYQNAHVFNFSLRSLANLLGKNGYEMVDKGNENVESMWKVSGVDSLPVISDYNACKTYLTKNNSFPFRQIHKGRKKLKIYYHVFIGRRLKR